MKFRTIFSTITAAILAMLTLAPATALTQEEVESSGQQVRIHTVLEETGEPFYDACYELEGFSNIGCDEDNDGVVTFADVPAGEYSLVQTADLGELQPVGEPGVNLGAITVHDSDINDFYITLIDADDGTDLGLITRDPETGAVLEGACYELVGYSKIGCDDDGNGIITFEDIPWGTYTVHQTQVPEGYDPMDNYEITLQPSSQAPDGSVNIPLLQDKQQGSETSTNISVVVVDVDTGDRVANEETCIEFPGMTNAGCDDDITDGQIDFMGVDPTSGQPTFDVLSLGCGWEAVESNDVIMHRYGESHTTLIFHVRAVPADCVD